MSAGTQLVDIASALFQRKFGAAPEGISPVSGDGSARRYWRLTAPGGERAVAAHGPDRDENRAFVSFSRTFAELGLPVPALYAYDDDAGVWLLEDLGNTTLFEALKEARIASGQARGLPSAMLPVYRRVLEWLPRFQVEGGRAIDFEVAYPREAFDHRSILWDLNYFKYHFLKLARVPFNEARLEADFERLAAFLLEADRSTFLYRDFQSRNIMLPDGPGESADESVQLAFIDYQGGRRGAVMYDVASLLYDAKADLDDPSRRVLIDHYLDHLERLAPVDRDEFHRLWPGYVLVRVLQALGAYGYRGFFERKARFLQSVPYAASNLETLLEAGLPLAVPELSRALGHVVDRWGERERSGEDPDRLHVEIGSFSYRQGYPVDTSGHGGGHVFDCRALPNPGREAAYRRLTGLDPATVEFLEARPEVARFWERVRDLVETHVDVYRQRGFHRLAVQFGCTGGQHRSVYLAERLAAHLRDAHTDIEVSVSHREAPDWPARERGD